MFGLRVIRVWGVLWMMALPAMAQTGEDTGQLVLLQRVLQERQLTVPGDSIPVPGCPLQTFHAAWDGKGLTDGGVNLFPEGMEYAYTRDVYDFIERFFLLFTLSSEEGKKTLLRQDGLGLRVNGADYGSSTVHWCSILQAVGGGAPFSLGADSAVYHASWKGLGLGVDFVFPKRYDLILGKDKKRLTEAFPALLKAYTYDTLAGAGSDFPESYYQATTAQNVFFDADGTFLIAQMKSGAYVRKKLEGGLEYVFDAHYPEESMLNVFSWGFRMRSSLYAGLTVKGYKFHFMDDVSIDRLTAFMNGMGCKAYVGIESVSGKDITGTVVYFNLDLMYEHLLYFKFPFAAFMSGSEKIELTLYPYIPLNNVGTLYDDASME